MKITSFVINLCAVFIFLTLGSLLAIVSFHLVAYTDLSRSLKLAYETPWHLVQMGALGFLMIVLGLAYAKTLVKTTEGSAVVFESRNGQVRVSAEAIQDSVRKILRKYTVIKEEKIKVAIDYQHVDVKIKLVLWTGVSVSDVVQTLQRELDEGLAMLLGPDGQIQTVIDIAKVLSHEPELLLQE